jgi:hypothetical protein
MSVNRKVRAISIAELDRLPQVPEIAKLEEKLPIFRQADRGFGCFVRFTRFATLFSGQMRL